MRRHLLRLSVLTAAALCTLTVAAQQRTLDPERYIYPVLNVAGLCSANFGEIRPNHFHSGIDIKTDGVEGKPVVAAADGYVTRIVVSPTGYGRALYVVHPHDGTMSVYGHLSAFRADLDSLVTARRYGRQRNAVDMWLPENRYTVSQGEVIARSGNTGNSFGPHLHYEIRDMRDNSTLNLIRQRVIPVRDTLRPLINALYYVEVDSLRNLSVHSAPRKIALQRTADGGCRTAQTVSVGPRGYFIAEVTDRKNSVTNRFGIYRITQKVDGVPVFEYRADGFSLVDSRYCNAVSFYPMQLDAKAEVIRLAQLEGAPSKFYTTLVERGTVTADDGQTRHVVIEVEDDCRNISLLEFDIEGRPASVQLPDTRERQIIDRTRPFSGRYGDISLAIPAEALYETALFDCGPSTIAPAAEKRKLGVITAPCRIMDAAIPLHTSAELSMEAFVPADMQKHVALAAVSPQGELSFAGGECRNGLLKAKISKFGIYCAVYDSIPPVVRQRFDSGADMRRSRALVFTLSDNFSGIGSYTATIDGHWVAADWSPIKAALTVPLDHRAYPYGTEHTVEITVSDNCGNTTVHRTKFFR